MYIDIAKIIKKIDKTPKKIKIITTTLNFKLINNKTSIHAV